MFRTVPLSIIRSFSLCTQQWYMSYRFADSLRAGSGRFRPDPARKLSANLRVQWGTPDDGQRNCPKHVEFYSKNKFKKLVYIVGFIIRICHDTRSSERQIQFLLSSTCFEYLMFIFRKTIVHAALYGMFSMHLCKQSEHILQPARLLA